MCISPTLPVHSLSTVKTSSRTQVKLRGILEQSGAPEVQCAWPSGEREREMFYLTTHSTHFIYGYMASDIWLRTILIVRKETRCRHIGYSYRLTARVLLYAPSHRQDNTYHGLCYTSRGALAGTRNSSMGPPHEGSIRRPIAPRANALPLSYVPLPLTHRGMDTLWHSLIQFQLWANSTRIRPWKKWWPRFCGK